MGDWWFRQEYLCEFVSTAHSIFPYEMLQAAVSDNVLPLFEKGER